MSLISRLFRRRSGDGYAEALGLYEEGRFAEAVAILRRQHREQPEGPTGSLVAFHLRQALIGEGKRLLEAGEAAAAISPLEEAADLWREFPDLQFLAGAARGLCGDWSAAHERARQALRRNPDYVEARLLEATALRALGRAPEAADSLNKLLESGRRVENELVTELARPGGYGRDDLPGDLVARLARAARRDASPADVGMAVELCRGGRWDEGITHLQRLVAGHPHYPDYRLKLAAALFQVGRCRDALEEVDRALALNPRYRTAICLKALVLADLRHLEEALAALRDFGGAAEAGRSSHHEDLFAAYLTAVLCVLTGRLDEVVEVLEPWGDLTATFPRAELLRAAVADLEGREQALARILAALVEAWPGDVEYHHLRACLDLRHGALDDVADALARWPAWRAEERDERPLHLAACLDVARRQPPRIPPPAVEGEPGARWRFVHALGLAASGDWTGCWEASRALWDEGWATERVARLSTAAAARLEDPGTLTAGWRPDPLRPDSLLPPTVFLLHRLGELEEARALVALHADIHPEELRWMWLDPGFWLQPIRRWIA